MKILRIFDKGKSISLDGTSIISTPAEIDISSYDISHVLNCIKRYLISDYHISINDKIKKKKKFIKMIKDDNNVNKEQNIDKGNDSNFNQLLLSKLNSLENLVKNINVTKEVYVKEVGETFKKSKISKDEEVDMFIPSVDTSNLKLEGNTEIKKEAKSDDTVDIAELLASIEKDQS